MAHPFYQVNATEQTPRLREKIKQKIEAKTSLQACMDSCLVQYFAEIDIPIGNKGTLWEMILCQKATSITTKMGPDGEEQESVVENLMFAGIKKNQRGLGH